MNGGQCSYWRGGINSPPVHVPMKDMVFDHPVSLVTGTRNDHRVVPGE